MVQYRLEFGRGVGGLGWRKPESWVFWFNPVMRGKSTGKVTSVLVATVTSVTPVLVATVTSVTSVLVPRDFRGSTAIFNMALTAVNKTTVDAMHHFMRSE